MEQRKRESKQKMRFREGFVDRHKAIRLVSQ